MTSRFLEDSVEIDLTRRVVTLPKYCHWYVVSCHVMSWQYFQIYPSSLYFFPFLFPLYFISLTHSFSIEFSIMSHGNVPINYLVQLISFYPSQNIHNNIQSMTSFTFSLPPYLTPCPITSPLPTLLSSFYFFSSFVSLQLISLLFSTLHFHCTRFSFHPISSFLFSHFFSSVQVSLWFLITEIRVNQHTHSLHRTECRARGQRHNDVIIRYEYHRKYGEHGCPYEWPPSHSYRLLESSSALFEKRGKRKSAALVVRK